MKTEKDFSCGGVVFDEKNRRLLIIKVLNMAGAHVWTFPKGHPEGNESDAEAALREVWEETGWTCRVKKHLMDVDYYFVRHHVRTHKTVRWFLMEPVEETGEPMEQEVLECRWATPEEARSLFTYDTDSKLMKFLGY